MTRGTIKMLYGNRYVIGRRIDDIDRIVDHGKQHARRECDRELFRAIERLTRRVRDDLADDTTHRCVDAINVGDTVKYRLGYDARTDGLTYGVVIEVISPEEFKARGHEFAGSLDGSSYRVRHTHNNEIGLFKRNALTLVARKPTKHNRRVGDTE